MTTTKEEFSPGDSVWFVRRTLETEQHKCHTCMCQVTKTTTGNVVRQATIDTITFQRFRNDKERTSYSLFNNNKDKSENIISSVIWCKEGRGPFRTKEEAEAALEKMGPSNVELKADPEGY